MKHILKEFREKGVVHLQNVIEVEKIKNLQKDLWKQINIKFGIEENLPETWYLNQNNPAGDSRALRLNGMNSIMNALNSQGKLKLVQEELVKSYNELFGRGRWEPLDKWYSLLSFPGEELNWSVPFRSWHNDIPIVVGDKNPWSIFTFIFLDDVSEENGPTVTVTGSHRSGELLAEDIGFIDVNSLKAFSDVNTGLISGSEELRLLPVGKLLNELVERDTWFQDLTIQGEHEKRSKNFLQNGQVFKNIQHKVEPIIGSPGDIVLLDPRCLHTFSANISRSPRQILRLDFKRCI